MRFYACTLPVRVCTRSFGDYATKNLPGDYNVICGRREARRDDATRCAVTPLPPRFSACEQLVKQPLPLLHYATGWRCRRRCQEVPRTRAKSFRGFAICGNVASTCPRRGVCIRYVEVHLRFHVVWENNVKRAIYAGVLSFSCSLKFDATNFINARIKKKKKKEEQWRPNFQLNNARRIGCPRLNVILGLI